MGKFKNITLFFRRNSLTILTLTISVMTLFIYVRQTSLLSRQTEILTLQNKASFWPRMFVGSDRGFSQKGDSTIFSEFSIAVANQGVGPAIIDKIVVKVGDKEFASWNELLSYASIDKAEQSSVITRFLSNRVVQPGEYLMIFSLKLNLKLASIMYEKGILQNLEISICYKSIYDEYWTVTIRDLVNTDYSKMTHVKSDSCQLKADVYFKD